jgi:hypothetical protein
VAQAEAAELLAVVELAADQLLALFFFFFVLDFGAD